MSFILQRPSGRGFALSQVHGNLLRIGRGTNAELRSENPAVALEHATIEGFTITDRGSITGTYVNGRPVESARLAKGDVIDIGDLRLEVQVAEPGKPLFLRVSYEVPDTGGIAAPLAEAAPIPGAGTLKAEKIDYVSSYQLHRPYLTKLSLVALLLIVTLAVIGEVTRRERQHVFMPGGVSSAHLRARDANGESIANNCQACHDPWRGVSDQRCTVCHIKTPHAELELNAPRCTDCHMEHRGSTKLAAISDFKCVECHSNLPAHRRSQWGAGAPAGARTAKTAGEGAGAPLDHISTFDDHPEFAVRTDGDTLRFNHRLHLQRAGIFNASGKREVLTCVMCHKLVEAKGKADPVAIKFDKDCQRCHRLTFDARFPDVEVPHGGDPGLVYGFVLATYAGNRDIAGKSPAEVRRLLTLRPQTTSDERAVLNAEQVIKTKCTLCHEIRRGGGRLAATPPVIPSRWWTHARFSHTQHRNIDCEACHTAARTSIATSDVLLPQRKACESCHGSQGTARGASYCLSCHEYHERSKMMTAMAPAFRGRRVVVAPSDGDGERMIDSILLMAIAILMLIVAVPVGIFLYQRLTAGTRQIPSVQAMQPKPQVPTKKVPAIVDVPPPPPPPIREETIVPETPAVGTKTEGGATEMVQWYGMLLCTGGPLEGQRFLIEEEGLYIGRDATLSKIVVNDSRISKRHVRIVPRNGKVMAIDQDSTNGTYLGKAGGQRITEVQLKRGDVLVLSDNAASFQYQI